MPQNLSNIYFINKISDFIDAGLMFKGRHMWDE